MTAQRPYTPDTLADRWQCSAETIRQMCHRGQLHHFRTGRMLRIPAQVVEEYECPTLASESSEAAFASTGPARTASECVVSLRHAPERKRKQKP
ncbi:helix-turn-helix domain-containing protein [Pseudooceanicola algae]|uniref:helix-turn-helix domain-containing protein n=1 Tax=Pseudooceanicola algae TaxID=1537215 RepID=UPI000E6C0875